MENIKWKVVTSEPMDEQDAKDYQQKNGYHPCGYGFVNFKSEMTLDNNANQVFITTWECWNSCD